MPEALIPIPKGYASAVAPGSLAPEAAAELVNVRNIKFRSLSKRKGMVHTTVGSYSGVIQEIAAFKRAGTRYLLTTNDDGKVSTFEDPTMWYTDNSL